jgi:membrane protein DedA with SNARE-associated domain
VHAPASGERQPSRRTLTLLVVPILVVIVIGNLGNLFHAPLLKEHPMWLVAMEPRTRFLLLVAEKEVAFWPFLAVASVRRWISDPLFYLLGFLYRDRAVRWMERKMGEGGVMVRFIERAFARAAPLLVLLIPGPAICVLAGATGMSPLLFAALNVLGTVAAVTLVYQLSEVLDGPLGAINRFYGNNTLTLFIITVVFLGIFLVSQYLQGRGEIQSISSIEKELTGDDEDGDEGADTRGAEGAEEVAAAGSGEAAPTAATKESEREGRSGSAGRPKHD